MQIRLIALFFLLLASCSSVGPAAVVSEPPGERPAAGPAAEAFERLKGLEGSWRGRSTLGWKDEVRFEVIAGGSVVMETSRFDAHPGETMVTMYHLDGERVLLTHYCVAGNQPRLAATAIEDGRIAFTFADVTGIASRDQGHMDSNELYFEGEALRSVWSWYQDGSSRPMEEIRLERAD